MNCLGMKKFVFASLFSAAVLALATSCSIHEPEGLAKGSEFDKIQFVMEDFEFDDATKVTTTLSGSTSVSVTWNDGDVIGVFPSTGGEQVTFTVASGAGTNNCVFDGRGWGLLSSTKYSAYYPGKAEYCGKEDALRAIQVSYTGQSQSAKGVSNAGDFDYLASTNATPVFADPAANGTCTFNFKHLGYLFVFDLTFPVGGFLNTLELECEDDAFTTAGTVDLSQETAVITSTAIGNVMTLDLGGMLVNANETVRFFMMVAPTTVVKPTIRVTTTAGMEMTWSSSSTYTCAAGRAKRIQATLTAPQSASAFLRTEPSVVYPDWKSGTFTFRVISNESYTMGQPTVNWLTYVSETVVNDQVKEYTYKIDVYNGSTARTGQIPITGETKSRNVSVTQSKLTLTPPVAGDGRTIYTTTGDFKYRYGPSIIMNDSGTIDAWFASPGHNGKADEFTWRRTSNGGQTWTAEQTVMTGGTKPDLDWWSVCDPGAACFDGYYYMAYTSTTNTSSDGGLQGLENDCFIARSTSPSGPWQRWNGSGWGGSPQPIIEYMDGSEYNDGPAGKWGIGEPSIVVKDETIYLYYTYDAGGTPLTKVATASRSNPNWPGNLTFHGTAVDKAWLADRDGVGTDNPLRGTYDSCDVKYVEDYDLFYAFHTSWRITQQSRLSVWTSTDGITFEYLGDVTGNILPYSHNMGVSGDGLGHVNLSKTQYVSYAFSPEVLPSGVTSRAKGGWSTYWSIITY